MAQLTQTRSREPRETARLTAKLAWDDGTVKGQTEAAAGSGVGPCPRGPADKTLYVAYAPDPILGGFVMFFGLFLFWVILSRCYRALGSMDDLLIEWPQVREVERPLLRSGLGAIRVPWGDYISEYTRDPTAAIRAANHASRLKFQAAVDAAYRRT